MNLRNLKSEYEKKPIIIATKQSKGIIFVLIKKAKLTNEQSFEKQIGTFTVMTIINTKSSQSERKKSPIFLVILFFSFCHYLGMRFATLAINLFIPMIISKFIILICREKLNIPDF